MFFEDIEKPILCGGKKFDLRFIVLLKSVVPLELYVYNLFYPRLANVDYTLDNLEVFEKHFTVRIILVWVFSEVNYQRKEIINFKEKL